MNTSYLIAKFAPDLKRMEPRNIGVIAWSKGKASAKFLGDHELVPKRIGVRDKANYQDWIESWKRQLNKPEIELDSGELISPSSDRYLESLTEWGSGNFMLVSGGSVVYEEDTSIKFVTDQLFQQLVGVESKGETEKSALTKAAKVAIEVSEIHKEVGYKPDFPAWYMPLGLTREIKFDHGIGPVKMPETVYQRIYLHQQSAFEQAVNHLHWFIKSREVCKDRCGAMVIVPEEKTKRIKDNIEMLKQVSKVIPMNDIQAAAGQIREMAVTG